jgi:HSP20 family protein
MTAFRNVYLEELERIQDRINTLFEQAVLATGYDDSEGGVPGTWAPPIDLLESADAFVLLAELSGVRREDLDLTIEERRVELSGRRHPLPESPNFLRMERSYGPFRRTFDLSEAIDVERASAEFRQGVLRIQLPKVRPSGARAITVQEGTL